MKYSNIFVICYDKMQQIYINPHLFTAGTCSSDADCLSQSCRNDSMSKCDTHYNHCHCTQRPACGHGHDTDCRNLHCSSGFKGTCSNGHCHCQRGMPYYIILYYMPLPQEEEYFISTSCFVRGRGRDFYYSFSLNQHRRNS